MYGATERSKLSDVEASIPSRSSPANVSSAQVVSCATERCSTITAFGVPVEPEV